MISYLCVKSQSLTSLHCRDILYTNKRTDGRVWIHRSPVCKTGDQKLIVLGILTYHNKILQVSLYYVKVSLCKISKANEFWLARYLNIYKSEQSKNKKINSSWNTHSINLRFCRFLCIMIRYHCVKFQSLTSFG